MKADKEINRMMYDIMKGDNYDAYLKALKEVLQKEDIYSICKAKVEKAVEKYKNRHNIIDPFGLDRIILQKMLVNKIPSYMLKPLDVEFFSNLTILDNNSALIYSLILQMDDKELYHFINSLYRSLVCVYPFYFKNPNNTRKMEDGPYTRCIANIIPDNTNNTLSYYIVSMDKELKYSGNMNPSYAGIIMSTVDIKLFKDKKKDIKISNQIYKCIIDSIAIKYDKIMNRCKDRLYILEVEDNLLDVDEEVYKEEASILLDLSIIKEMVTNMHNHQLKNAELIDLNNSVDISYDDNYGITKLEFNKDKLNNVIAHNITIQYYCGNVNIYDGNTNIKIE